nr:hypothetical protein CFP56_09226 [Quercus suber]
MEAGKLRRPSYRLHTVNWPPANHAIRPAHHCPIWRADCSITGPFRHGSRAELPIGIAGRELTPRTQAQAIRCTSCSRHYRLLRTLQQRDA